MKSLRRSLKLESTELILNTSEPEEKKSRRRSLRVKRRSVPPQSIEPSRIFPSDDMPSKPSPKGAISYCEGREHPLFQLKQIVYEIVDTEQRYVEDLTVMIEEIMTPMAAKRNFLTNELIVSPKQMQSIWSNITMILPLNKEFLERILPAKESIDRMMQQVVPPTPPLCQRTPTAALSPPVRDRYRPPKEEQKKRKRKVTRTSLGSLEASESDPFLWEILAYVREQEGEGLFSPRVEISETLSSSIYSSEEAANLPSPQVIIGRAVMESGEFFKNYLPYCTNQKNAMDTLQELCVNSQFEAFLAERADIVPACRHLTLKDMLIKPIQRVCKYPLLLRELLKCTEEDTEEYETLVQAQLKIESVIKAINSAKKAYEYQNILMEISSDVSPKGTKLISPSRRIYRLGVLPVIQVGSTLSTTRLEVTMGTFVLASDRIFVISEAPKTKRNKHRYQVQGDYATGGKWRVILSSSQRAYVSSAPEDCLYVPSVESLEFVLEQDEQDVSLLCQTESQVDYIAWLQSLREWMSSS